MQQAIEKFTPNRRVSSPVLKPFIKWAGGKRWLIADPTFELPEFSGRYIEPFLGGGAVFFHTRPQDALLSDVNSRLIEVYTAVRDSWELVFRELKRLQRLHDKKFYYEERKRNRVTSHTRAAQFIYLNRTCYNGLYRVNLKGEFNVPIGTKSRVLFEDEDFAEISRALSGATIRASDFAESIREAGEGDLVFADPPYTTAHNTNGFVRYNQNIFSWQDQLRLKIELTNAVRRGAKVVLTNADHESIRDLYRQEGRYRPMGRASLIAGNSLNRNKTTEAIYVIE
ncbi:DNA adenine methylase [Luteolibacter algae]|uniref:Site-specific DNA-methyltransferase (adenine-specific) n=1 Tax=Luteolibacter algae TaxID=454151 RepID=A0ABW5D7Z7_9BACT